MDLKSFYLLISTLVVGAAVVTGWLEARNERRNEDERTFSPEARTVEPVGRRQSPAAGPASRRAGTFRSHRPRRFEGDVFEPDPASGAGSARSAVSPPSGEFALATAEEERELGRIEALLVAHDFARAAAEARKLADQSTTIATARALQLEAKALAFAQLVPGTGPGAGPGTAPGAGPTSSEIFRILLSNSSTIEAVKVEEEPDRYLVTFAGGEVRKLLREDVLKVESAGVGVAAPTPFVERQWEDIEASLKRWQHPIDLYVRGVRKCYQLGLREQGYRLLEKLLTMPGSEQVPRFFGREEDNEEVVRQWLLAAGRDTAREEAGDREDRTAMAEGASRGGAMTEDASLEALGHAHQLVGEARAAYRNAAGKEGRDDELRRAYEQLRRAQDVLGQLPPDREVSRLSREVSALIFDVGRSLPFDG